MGSSPKTDTSPGTATPQPGATPPPAAAPFLSAGFPGPAQYQGFSGQPFNPAQDVYASFLPSNPTASATGLDRNMLNAIMGISPKGAVPGGQSPAGATDPAEAAGAAMSIPQLAAPEEGSMRGWFRQAAQQVADSSNKAGTLDAYLEGRDMLAKLQQLGRFRRGQGSVGYSGSSHGGNSMAAAGGGAASNAAGMGGLSSGGLY